MKIVKAVTELWDKMRASISAAAAPKTAAAEPLPLAQPDETAQLRASVPQLASSPLALPALQSGFLALLALAIAVILFLRLFRLDSLQTEVYPDIDIVRDFVRQVLVGGWPVKFNLSAGPLYEYLISPVILLTGLNYLGLKIASVLVSLVCLAATYAFSRRLVNDYFALLTTFIAGISSWLLIFSRLGNLLIFLPVLTMLALWLVVRIVQFGRLRDVFACALIAGMGLFVYPQSYILPGVIFATLLCLHWTGKRLPRGWVVIFVSVSLVCGLLFAAVVASDPSNFTSGYVGNKINPAPGQSVVGVLAGNILNALLALHVRGDNNFRSNPASLPLLDVISGILFLAGLVFWSIAPERRRWMPVWLVPLILLEIPSVLALNQPGEVPSASRTVGVAPIIYMLVASGLWWLIQLLLPRLRRWPVVLLTSLLLTAILAINAQRYFQTYMDGLPYAGTPVAHSIADYTNTLPDGTHVYMVGCCWVDGMPELFVRYDMTRPDSIDYVNAADLSCAQLQVLPLPAVFIWSFHDPLPAPQLETCRQWLAPQVYEHDGWPVFNAATLYPSSIPLLAPTPSPTQPALEQSQAQLDGQTVTVEYSPLDTGSITDLFDGSTATLIRGRSANPLVVMLRFAQPRKLSAVDLDLGSLPHFHVEVVVTYTDGHNQGVGDEYKDLPPDPHVAIALPENTLLITALQVMIQDMDPAGGPDGYHTALRELRLR